MNLGLAVWLTTCALGFALSLKSVSVLGPRSRWTAAGWAFTAIYFAIAAYDAARAAHASAHLDYVDLAILTICFIIAGRRDEPQAEPWYWPTFTGQTGAERRAKGQL